MKVKVGTKKQGLRRLCLFMSLIMLMCMMPQSQVMAAENTLLQEAGEDELLNADTGTEEVVLIGEDESAGLIEGSVDNATGTLLENDTAILDADKAAATAPDEGDPLAEDIQADGKPDSPYELWVGGVAVTDKNKNDILGDGKISYDPQNGTLNLNDVKSFGRSWDYYGYTKGPEIFYCAIYTKKGLKITGSCDVTASANTFVYADGVSVAFDGDFGYTGTDMVTSNTVVRNAPIAIVASTVYITGTRLAVQEYDRYYDYMSVIKSGSIIYDEEAMAIYPQNAKTDNGEVRYGIQKAPGAVCFACKYDVWVGDTRVDDYNKSNIPVNMGSASYDPETHTLNLYNASVAREDETFYIAGDSVIYSEGDLNIYASGNVNVNSANKHRYGIKVQDGTLSICGSWLKINNATTCGIQATGDITLKEGKTSVQNSGSAAISSEKGTVILDDYLKITSPSGAYVKGGTIVKDVTVSGGQGQAGPTYTTVTETVKSVTVETSYDDYNLMVGGVRVNEKNKDSIPIASGTAKYDPQTCILTFEDAVLPTVVNTKIIGIEKTDSEELVIMGRVTIPEGYSTGIAAQSLEFRDADVTITAQDGISSKDILVVKSSRLNVNYKKNGGYGIQTGDTLYLNGENIRIFAKGKNGTGISYKGINFRDLFYDVKLPAGGYIGTDAVYLGEEISESAEIVNAQKYDLWVGGRLVSSANKDDIFGDGSASYDPVNKVLTLDSYKGTGKLSEVGSGETSRKLSAYIASGDSLRVKGTAQLKEDGLPDYGIYSGADLAVEGEFTVKAKETALYAKNNIEFTKGNIDASSTDSQGYGACAWNGDAKMAGGRVRLTASNTGLLVRKDIVIDGGKLEASGDYCGINAAGKLIFNKGNLKGISKDCAITAGDKIADPDSILVVEPQNGRISDSGMLIVDETGKTAAVAELKKAEQPVEGTDGEIWNLFESGAEHRFEVSGLSANIVAENKNVKSKNFYDAKIMGSTITVKVTGDRKKASAASNSLLEFDLGEAGILQYALPVTYKKPDFKLDPASVLIAKGRSRACTRLMYKADSKLYEPYDMIDVEVTFGDPNIASIDWDDTIVISTTTAQKGKIKINKPGWNPTDPVELSFTVNKLDRSAADLALNDRGTIVVNTHLLDQRFGRDLLFKGERIRDGYAVVVNDKKNTGLVSVDENGRLTVGYKEGVKAGSYTIGLEYRGNKTSVKVRVSDKPLDKAVTGKVQNKLDVVTGRSMVIVPSLKEVSGTIENVSVASPAGYAAKLNPAGNIVVDYVGPVDTGQVASKPDAKNLNIGDVTLNLKISGCDTPLSMTVKNVKADKTTPTVKASAVTVSKRAGAGRVIGVANITSTYKVNGAMRSVKPVKVEIQSTKGVEAEVNGQNISQIDIKSVSGKSGSVTALVTYPGGVEKKVNIKVSAK